MRFEADLPGARVLFSTRVGGLSDGPFSSLNLGLLTGDDRGLVIENRKLFAEMAEIAPGNVVMGWQVHGNEIREWEGPDPDTAFLDPQGGHLKVDGHITSDPALAALVLVADCLPVAIAGGGSVAMLHCGWRGLAGGIIPAAVERLGGSGARLGAAVGPGINDCCYEVGPEVLEAFAGYDGVADGRWLSLRDVADQQLRAAGIEAVDHVDLCTSCNEQLFFSHRRDKGTTGRQGGLAWLTG